MAERPQRSKILLPENPRISFEHNPTTQEVTMVVCGQPLIKKRVANFDERMIRRTFGPEIEDNKDIVCPTEMGKESEEAESSTEY